MKIWMKSWMCPAIPFALSLSLSLSTIGKNVFWQDSGFYLAAVKDLGVLYPPGFVLYLLVCKLWTGLFFFLDFALAVHLFSSFCAALASGTIAIAVRSLLNTRSPMFKVLDDDPGRKAGWCGAMTGCFASTGYTFWISGLYAKGYALLYLVLSLLIWRMIRAAETKRPRDFTYVAILIGLAWQIHPSASLAGAALILYVLVCRSIVGWRGLVWRLALAAVVAAGPALLLPVLDARETPMSMGRASFRDIPRYLAGSRFTEIPGVFGFDPIRWRTVGQYFWEEMLGIGIVTIVIGLVRSVRANRRLLLGICAWTVPYVLGAVLFKMEGQQDHWFVAAWLPLYLALGLGLHTLATRVGRYAPAVLGGLTVVSVTWAVVTNYPLLNQRRYDLAELYGRCLLDPLEPDAILLVQGDDALGSCLYLQEVRNHRRDILIVVPEYLADRHGGLSWYDDRILRRDPRLRPPDYVGTARRFSFASGIDQAQAAFANANASRARPIYFMYAPRPELIRADFALTPAGAFWKLVPQEEARRPVDPRYWDLPITPEEVRRRYRRERGIWLKIEDGSLRIAFEPYERRLMRFLIRARWNLAYLQFQRGTTDGLERAARLLESIRELDPRMDREPEDTYLLARAYFGLGRYDESEKLLRELLATRMAAKNRAGALVYLGEIARKHGREAEAQRRFAEAHAVPGLDPESIRQIESAQAGNPQ